MNRLTIINEELKQRLANEKTQYIGAIHHYTSPEGMKGILESGNFWYTHARFLNDSSECNYIYRLFPKFPDVYNESLLDEQFFNLIRGISNSFLNNNYYKYDDENSIIADDIYVVSFSQDDDSLPLWNYYTKNNDSIGYNISFSILPFDYSSMQFKFIHGSVIYDKDKQKELLKEILLKYNEFFIDNKNQINSNPNHKKNFIEQFINILELYNIFFKHSAYEPEKEYRAVVYSVSNYAGMTRQFRTHKGLYIPYISLGYDKPCISRVNIAPNNNNDLYEYGTKMLLQTLGLNNLVVKNSGIPKQY